MFIYVKNGHFLFLLNHQNFQKKNYFDISVKIALFFKDLVWANVLTSFWVTFLIFESVLVKRVGFFSEKTEKILPSSTSVKAPVLDIL